MSAATTERRGARVSWSRLRLAWHASMAGSFSVAYMTGDEDTWFMHLFSGYLLLGLVAVRLLAMVLDRRGGGLRRGFAGRLALGVLAAAATAGLSGVVAQDLLAFEDPHEALSHIALMAALAHGLVMVGLPRIRRYLRRSGVALLVLGALATPVLAGEGGPRAALLAGYAAEARAADPAFAGFSADRGRKLFTTRFAGGHEKMPSCSACHTEDPTARGRHVRTGRPIDPVAVSANPERFTDPQKVEKRFRRDCDNVLGRACTATEKGDYITFMSGR